ncbi:MAG: CBS domain-containing protein [Polyangiaceae bacterium]|nr:CBS domain-containing protein [Polyangiaceae bacterium]
MTKSPYSIGTHDPLSKAHSLMHEHGIRHLPVLHGAELVGVVSDRDLHLVESLTEVDPSKVTVEEAMTTIVYAVAPSTPLDEVVGTMATKKCGSAVVMEAGKVVGIFTTIDLCKAFAEHLHGHKH